jgi:hypothetical protein
VAPAPLHPTMRTQSCAPHLTGVSCCHSFPPTSSLCWLLRPFWTRILSYGESRVQSNLRNPMYTSKQPSGHHTNENNGYTITILMQAFSQPLTSIILDLHPAIARFMYLSPSKLVYLEIDSRDGGLKCINPTVLHENLIDVTG